jgi:hypothetical protein
MPAEPTTRAATTCPACGAEQDLHTNATGVRPPVPGDVAVCWRCGGVAVFTTGPFGLLRRPPTAAEEATIRSDPRITRLLDEMWASNGPTAAAKTARGDRDG